MTDAVPDTFIRLMHENDVPRVLDIWRQIGLHEGLETIQSFMQVDPQGFYVCVNQQTGKITQVPVCVHNQ